jgi:SAM-dependent methyltransferase
MRLKDNFLFNYIKNAPLALGIERSLECEIMRRQKFERPVLDIGCGDGLFSYILVDEKIDVGIDPDGRELERARKYGMYDELIQCCGDNIPKESGTFNTILSNSVLEHIAEPFPVLNEASRLLGQGGKFYVTVPTDMFDRYSILYRLLSLVRFDGLAQRYRKFFNGFWKHFHFHNSRDWERIFTDSGFEVVGSEEYCSKTICLLNDLLAPFAFLSFVIKKMLNRWTICPNLRAIYMYPFYLIACYVTRKYEVGDKRGIIFFSLRKK